MAKTTDKPNGKTKVEALAARRVDEEAALATLQGQAASKDAAIKALEELAAADLAAVPVSELERESKKQAQAKVEAEALRIEVAELRRRIAKQQAVIAATDAAIAVAEREALVTEATALFDGMADAAQALLSKTDRMAKLDQELRMRGGHAPVGGYFWELSVRLKSLVRDAQAQRARQA